MENLYKKFPDTPGVYRMKNKKGELLYIGKAGNLKRRVSSYFQKSHDTRIERLVSQVHAVGYTRTDTALEALILEAQLIKKYKPPYNIREKDDTSFLYVEITKDAFPRVLLVRGKDLESSKKRITFGPFTSGTNIREALRILRKIFPWSTHISNFDTFQKNKRGCFDFQIGLCPGTCVGAITKSAYQKNICNLKLIFQGRKKKILKDLKKDMQSASKKLQFEVAAQIKKQIFALQHIQDVALIQESDFKNTEMIPGGKFRIEGYDISNISGTSSVGSMVVSENGKQVPSQYRKFKIRTFNDQNDTGMLQEVVRRRLAHKEWPIPNLFLIDGGKGQISAVRRVLEEEGLRIPVLGIAKGSKRKKNEFIGSVPKGISKKLLIRTRDEAHRFAVSYHKALRQSKSFS